MNLWKLAENIVSIIFQIIVEAVRGAHYTSDVSIDNFKFETGLCPKEAAGNDTRMCYDLFSPLEMLFMILHK